MCKPSPHTGDNPLSVLDDEPQGNTSSPLPPPPVPRVPHVGQACPARGPTMCCPRCPGRPGMGLFFPSFFSSSFSKVYFFLRQRETEHEHEQGRGRERGRHRIRSRLQAPSCQHRARRGARTHGLRDQDLSGSRMPNRLSYPGAPPPSLLPARGGSFPSHRMVSWIPWASLGHARYHPSLAPRPR